MAVDPGGLKRFHARVEGRVQGVGFRYFVSQTAGELGVKGWVRNRWDGSVELVAEGRPEDLARLAAAVRKGPRSSVVTDVKMDWEEPAGEFGGFHIRSTG